jgi:CubicO group peptidase (beta-lactamase class C family)
MLRSVSPVVTLWLAALFGACGPLSPTDAQSQLQAAVSSAVSGKRAGARHGVLLVDAPKLGVTGTFVAGPSNGHTGAAFAADTPFLAASVGKLFVAAAVTSLARDGVLSLDDRLDRWVDPSTFAGLPVKGGDAALAQVTLRQLLGHRSGLPDAFSGSPSRDGAPTIVQLMKDAPERAWTRDDLFAYARAHFDPAGAPGAQFLYSDLNYDLLGLVLERADQAPWNQVVRRRVLAPLALSHTWYYNLEAAPDGVGELSDVFAADVNLARQPLPHRRPGRRRAGHHGGRPPLLPSRATGRDSRVARRPGPGLVLRRHPLGHRLRARAVAHPSRRGVLHHGEPAGARRGLGDDGLVRVLRRQGGRRHRRDLRPDAVGAGARQLHPRGRPAGPGARPRHPVRPS